MSSQVRFGGAARGALVTAFSLGLCVAACGDDVGGTAASGTGGSAATGAGGAGGAAPLGEALVCLINLEDDIFEVEIEGDPYVFLPMNLGAGVVFKAPLVDCGPGVGTCLELFREGFTDPTPLPVLDGGSVLHLFAGAAGEGGDETSSEALPEPGLAEAAVVVRSYLVGPQLTLLAPAGTLNPLADGVAIVDANQEIGFVLEDLSILESGIVLEQGKKYAIAASPRAEGGLQLVACPLRDGEDCQGYSYN
jgi:hypothetical protein